MPRIPVELPNLVKGCARAELAGCREKQGSAS
jgi:hypothetical protein